FLAKKQKQSHFIPQRLQMKIHNTVRYSSKRRYWRGTRLCL
ncbi:hypothetical protein DBR06_SOUSAS2510160, partial [Sousa chinensis]